MVIKLGEDSDSDESDASDTESAKKTATNREGSGGGLFGGLEMMIKEARKSAEVNIPLTLIACSGHLSSSLLTFEVDHNVLTAYCWSSSLFN